MNKHRFLTVGWMAVVLLLVNGPCVNGPSIVAAEVEVMTELKKLRGIEPTKDKEELARLSKQMDSAWAFLEKNRLEAVPIVTRELRKELDQKKESRDQFFLLDSANFLISSGEPAADAQARQNLALEALEQLDPKAQIIQFNLIELVRFTHALAKLGDARVLPQIDRIFLDSTRGVEFFEAPHYVKLPAQSVRVLLYGATGPSAEDHLAKRLNEPGYEKHQRTIVALLVELGSERSVTAVKRVLETRNDFDHFAMVVTMLMLMGGPSGRDTMLAVKTDQLDEKSRDYYQRISEGIKTVSFESLAEAVKQFDDSKRTFNDVDLAKRLEEYAKTGVDRELNPSNVVNSGIAKQELLKQLKQIRARSLWRLNQHALEDVHLTNQVINAVQYKP